MPATIKRLTNVTMAALDQEVCLVYLDDIIEHSPDLDSHFDRAERLFERLGRVGLKL